MIESITVVTICFTYAMNMHVNYFYISVCGVKLRLSVCPSVNFPHFRLILQNHWFNFNQTWHKTSLGNWNSSLFKWKATFVLHMGTQKWKSEHIIWRHLKIFYRTTELISIKLGTKHSWVKRIQDYVLFAGR